MTSKRALPALAVAAIGMAGAVAVSAVGSTGWIAGGYSNARVVTETWRAPGVTAAIAGDENFWLSPAGAKALTPVLQDSGATAAPLQAKGFEIGARVTVAGSERLKFEVVSLAPLPRDSGMVDAQGRALLLVTARETSKGDRVVRFIVDADAEAAAPAAANKAL